MAKAPSSDDRILASLEHRKPDATLAVLTEAIFKAARKDRINLDKAFDDKKTGQKAFNDQLRIALHICENRKIDGKMKVIYCSRAEPLFTSSNPNKKSEEYKRKEVLRSNFAHNLKLAAQVAAGLIDMEADVTMDHENGTLIIYGRGVKKKLGKEPIVLKTKQARGVDEKGTTRMSYTVIAANAAEKRHATLQPRADSRKAVATLESQSKLLIGTIRLRDGPLTKREKAALTTVLSAIEKALQ